MGEMRSEGEVRTGDISDRSVEWSTWQQVPVPTSLPLPHSYNLCRL